jgi:hypothetical protein
LAILAMDELIKPTNEELLKCIINNERVLSIINEPNLKYKGPQQAREYLAATKIAC